MMITITSCDIGKICPNNNYGDLSGFLVKSWITRIWTINPDILP